MRMYPASAVKLLKMYESIENPLPDGDMDKLTELGLAFPARRVHHDEALRRAFEAYSATTKHSIAKSFILGLETGEHRLCAPLSSYAIMTHYPDHKFSPLWDRGADNDQCDICGSFRNENVDFTLINHCRWDGGLISRNPDWQMFNLEAHLEEELDEVRSVNVMLGVLECIHNSSATDKLKDISKRIASLKHLGIKSRYVGYFIDAFGYAGIMQTPKHVGWIYKYPGCNPPRSSRSTDSPYPVDFWRGVDGVNFRAIEYWFSEFEEVMEWVKLTERVPGSLYTEG